MRILLINFEYPPLGGGAGNATMFMAKSLVALGHEPTVLTSAIKGLPRESAEEGIKVRRIPALRSAPDRTDVLEMASFLGSSVLSAGRVARATRSEAVVVYFTIPCGPAGWLLHQTLGLPYVVSLRGGDVPGHVPEIKLFHRLLTPVRRAILRRAHAVVANAPGLAEKSERADHVPVEVIPNGVDTEFFHPAAPGELPTDGAFRILYVGRLHELKNIDRLLDAVAWLAAEGVAVRLDVVGGGDERARLEAQAVQLGLADRVTWHGWKAKEDVAPLYRHASCFVNPSRYEGMPNTVLEAMASGIPVVASDVGGNNDLVVPDENGWLFDLARPEGLRLALKAAADDPEGARGMGKRGRESAVRDYSWVGVTRRYLDLLTLPGRSRPAKQASLDPAGNAWRS